MAIKRILVHCDGTGLGGRRLEAAVGLAVRFQARLIGLFVAVEGDDRATPARTAAEMEFQAVTKGAGIVGDWQVREAPLPGQVVMQIIMAARLADLTVLGPDHSRGSDGSPPNDLAEQIALHGGRPILVVPAGGPAPGLGGRVLVAWNGGREAARSLADALPLLAAAREVLLVHLVPPGDWNAPPGSAHPTAAGPAAAHNLAGVIDYLADHGVNAVAEQVPVEDLGVLDLVLARAAERRCDLLVIGAHGAYAFPLFHRGAATRYLLRHLTLPVLMSH